MSTKTRPVPSRPQESRTEGISYDRVSGRLGFGRIYGEHSFNYRPVQGEPTDGEANVKRPFSPITPPNPRADSA